MLKRSNYALIIVTVIGVLLNSLILPLNINKVSADTPIRGAPGDLWADIAIGTKNFEEAVPYTVVPDALHLPHGVFIDRNNPSDEKMYVFDAGNSRILGYDLEDCRDNGTNPLNCQPDLIFGQVDGYSATCNGDLAYQTYPIYPAPTASTICGMRVDQLSISEGGSGASMDVDSEGNLYFPDFWNNRVLKYNQPFSIDTSNGKGDVIADEVWGQINFTSRDCNKGTPESPSATSLCFTWGNSNNWTAGVDIDGDGNLWIVDSGNNRVLKYLRDTETGIISKTPILVLGQNSFTTRVFGTGFNRMRDPNAVRVVESGPDKGTVFVSERYNSRVMKFTSPATNASGTIFGSGFTYPHGLDWDPTETDKIWISNDGDCSIELWTIAGSGSLSKTLGDNNCNITSNTSGSLGIDSSGNLYAATGEGIYNNSVIIYDKGGSVVHPDGLLYTPTGSGNLIDTVEVGSVRGLAVTDDQLIVADQHRMMYWNLGPGGVADLETAQPSDGVIVTDPELPCCLNMKTDDIGHLYTTFDGIYGPSSAVAIYDLPLEEDEEPLKILDYPMDLLGGGTTGNLSGTYGISGIEVTSNAEFIWISSPIENRVIRVRDPLGSSPVVDVILGQLNSSGDLCNRGGSKTSNTLCRPGNISYDNAGNLYISDHWLEIDGNMRMVIYDSGTIPTNNVSVLYADDLTPSQIRDDIATWEPAFDSQDRMVVGYNPYWPGDPVGFDPGNGYFPAIFDNPNSSDLPTAFLKDYFSMALASVFDSNDNLIVGDLNRGRILIYLQPLNEFPPTLEEVTPVSNPTTDTTPDYTFSSSEAGSITYGGDCSSSTTSAAVGNNTITFNPLSLGTHSNCTIRVTDSDMEISEILNVSSFTIVQEPVISQVTGVPTPTVDETPDYTFTTNKAGTITYGGDCSSSTTAANVGSNTITFNTLSLATHSNCTIRITDTDGFQSNLLAVNTFTISFKPYGDLNNSRKVDLSDLSILASYWMTNNANGDVNSDGIVNLSDLSILAGNWLRNL